MRGGSGSGSLHEAHRPGPAQRTGDAELARVSLLGKFRVEVEGVFVVSCVIDTLPPCVGPVTVRLPVTATAFAGMRKRGT